ncbi:bolA-like protein 3 isoform X2 [Cyclopterus lumpus]|uniref:BolA-like protein 3 n=1 Tax=Cyclopterus lumpus TaxID=8103 RepID=A0A8C3G6E1_CYCLU|nr:bolA-like protein 3 isoform X2 [Cyclopterus lumpus]
MLACKRILTRAVTSALRGHRSSNEVVVSGRVRRWLCTQTDGEARIATVLKEKFPLAASLKVVDISGGCGAMYEIHIESNEFKGKRTVQQHKLVNQALKEEIQGMHGLRIFTDVPKH